MLFLGAIGIILAIGVGVKLSEEIDEFIIVFLFWLLYIVTIATFINIILVVNYYLTMRHKTGIQGPSGKDGDQGETGKSGICDPGCRDSICEVGITNKLRELLQARNPTIGKIRFNNIYIKGKIKQMCSSKEFKQLVPYNGPQNLINYLNDIWTIWFNLLYDAGELKYFENIAAETEFEWKTDNPFNELKKYDVFYWGLGKQYRPNIIEKCHRSNDGDTIYNGPNDTDFAVATTNIYTQIGTTNVNSMGISIWRADQFTYKGTVYYPVGDVIIGPVASNNGTPKDINSNPYEGPYDDSVVIKRHVGDINFEPRPGPNRETILVSGLVQGPTNYDSIMSTGIYVWRPIPPAGYVSLGDIVTIDNIKPPTGDSAPIRCVKINLAIVTPPNGKTLYKSTTMMFLGFNPHSATVNTIYNVDLHTAQSHCYNMFRAVVGTDPTNLPTSDTNGSFYYLDVSKFNAIYTIGVDYGQPSTDKQFNKVGQGYIPFPTRGSQYSILPYLNLRSNVTLKHSKLNTLIYAKIIPNSISNNYSLNTVGYDDKTNCLNYDGNASGKVACDNLMTSQAFSINFTGKLANQCVLQHNDTQKILSYTSDTFTLIDQTGSRVDENTLFIIQ